MNICEVWLVLKEVKALLPVASLWACLDYKGVANWPIRVSRILLLTKLISEINPEIRFQRVVIWAKILLTTLVAAVGCGPTTTPRETNTYKSFYKFILLHSNIKFA